MRGGAIISLVASAALGLGALFVARIWLPQQNAKASPTAAPVVTAGVPVVLAASAIPYGVKLEAKQLALVRMPADAVPPGAFTSVDQVMKQDAGGAPVALTAISEREPILPSKLSGPGARPTMSALIGEGMRAYTIGVTEVAGGGGHVLPGDRVDVVVTREISAATPMDGGHGKLVSEVVIQNVRVLGMDLNIDPNSTHPTVARTASLEVGVEDAERLALAAQAGTLSLALRRTGAAEIKAVRPMLTADLGPGAAAQAGPARRSSSRRGAPARAAGGTVVVTLGAERKSVSVPIGSFGGL